MKNTDARFQKIRDIATEGATKIEGYLVDAFTGSMLVQIHDALNETNAAKFRALPLTKMVDVGWALVERSKA